MRVAWLGLVLIVLSSCSKTTPAGFWSAFRSDFIIDQESDQGPYGGHSKIYWKTNDKARFTSEEVLSFAKNNGWVLVDSSKDIDSTVYSFETGWLKYDPGTDNSTEINGFVVIKNNGLEMEVSHKWGE